MFRRVELERDTVRTQPVSEGDGHTARQARTYAETSDEYLAYEMAAAEFAALGMAHAAEACRQRAAHYRSAAAAGMQSGRR